MPTPEQEPLFNPANNEPNEPPAPDIKPKSYDVTQQHALIPPASNPHPNARQNQQQSQNSKESDWRDRLIGDGPPAHIAEQMRDPPFRPRETTDAQREAVRLAKLRVYGNRNKPPDQA